MLVLESHDIPGGAAHSWVQKGYHFESGPSLYSDMASTGEQIFSELNNGKSFARGGLIDSLLGRFLQQYAPLRVTTWVPAAGRAANPLAQVLQAIGEPLDLIEYNTWNILVPEGEYLTEVWTARQAIGCCRRRHAHGPTCAAAQACSRWSCGHECTLMVAAVVMVAGRQRSV